MSGTRQEKLRLNVDLDSQSYAEMKHCMTQDNFMRQSEYIRALIKEDYMRKIGSSQSDGQSSSRNQLTNENSRILAKLGIKTDILCRLSYKVFAIQERKLEGMDDDTQTFYPVGKSQILEIIEAIRNWFVSPEAKVPYQLHYNKKPYVFTEDDLSEFARLLELRLQLRELPTSSSTETDLPTTESVTV